MKSDKSRVSIALFVLLIMLFGLWSSASADQHAYASPPVC